MQWTAMRLPSNIFPSKSNSIYVEEKDNLQADVDHQVENTNFISTTPNIHNTRNAVKASNLYTGNTSFVDCKTDNILNDNNSTSTNINLFSVTDEYGGNSAMQSAHNSPSSSFFYKDIPLSSELIYDSDEEDVSKHLLYETREGYISDCEEYEDDYYSMVENSKSEDEMQIFEVANDTTCVAESHTQTFDFGHISEELDEVTTTTIENTFNTSALIYNQLNNGDELKVSNEKGITSFRNRSKSVEILSETANITNISELEELSVCNSVNQSSTDKENELCTTRRRTKSLKDSTEFVSVNNTSGIKELPFDNFVNYIRSKRKCHNETEIFDFDDVFQTSTPRIYNVSDKMNVRSGQKESNQRLDMKQMYETSKPIGKQTSIASHFNKSLNTLEMQHLCDTPNVKNSIIETLEGTGSASNSLKVKKIVYTPHVQKSINSLQVNLQDTTVKHNVSKSISEGVPEMLKAPFVEKSINNHKVSLQYLTSQHDKPASKEFVKMPNVTLRSSTVKHKSISNIEEGQEMFKISRVEEPSDISNINHFLNASCAEKSNTLLVSLENLVLKSEESTPNTESVKKTVKIPQIGKTTLNITLPNFSYEQDEPTFNFEGVGEMLQIPHIVVSTGNPETISEYLTPKHNQSASNFKRSKESPKTPHGEKSTDNLNADLESVILESNKSKFNSKRDRVVVKVPLDDTFMNVYNKKRLLQTSHDEKGTNEKNPTLESPSLQHDESKSNYEGVKEMFKMPYVERSTDNPNDFLEIFPHTQNESKSNPKGGLMSVMTPCGDEVFCATDPHDEMPTNNKNSTLESPTLQHNAFKSNYEGVKEIFKTPCVEMSTNNLNDTLESFPIETDKLDYEGIAEKFKILLVHKSTGNSNTSFKTSTLDHIGSKSNFERTCKMVVETSHVDKAKDVSDMQLLSHTPHVKTFTNKENSTLGHDESNYEGIKEVLKTSHDAKFSNDQNVTSQNLTVEPDKSDYESIKEKFKTLLFYKSAGNSNTSFEASTLDHIGSKSNLERTCKMVVETSHVDKAKDVSDMQLLSHTPHVKTFTNKENSTLGHDESNYEGIKEVLKTSHDAKFSNDQNVTLQNLTVEPDKSDYESIKEKFKTLLVHKSAGNSNTSFEASTLDHIGSKSNLEKNCKTVVEASQVVKSKDASDMQLLSHTPHVKTFTNKENSTLGHDESNYEGIGVVLKTPHDDKFSNDQNVTSQSLTVEPDKFDYEGIEEKSKTPLFHKSTGNPNTIFETSTLEHIGSKSNLERTCKTVVKTSQVDKSKGVSDMQLLSHTLDVNTFTNKENSTLGHDESNYEGIKEVLKTPHDDKFSNDQNVTSQSLTVEPDKSDYEGIKEKSKTSLVHKSTGNSNTSFEASALDHIGSKSNLERTCKTVVETSQVVKSKDVSDMQLLSHTPHIITFTNKENSTLGHDESNYEGNRVVLKMPHDDKFSNDQSVTSQSLTVESAKFDYEGIKEKSKTLLVYKSTDNSNTSFETSQTDKSKDVFNMQLLFHTPHVKTFTNKENSTTGHDESNYEGVKEVLETSHDAKFSNDQNVTSQSLTAEPDQSDYEGIEEKSKTPLFYKSTANPNTSFETSTLEHIGSKSNLERTCKTVVETSQVDKSKGVSDMQLLSHTLHVNTFTNKENSTLGHDESNYEGIKEVLETSHDAKFSNDQNVTSQSLAAEPDKSDYEGIEEKSKTLLVHKSTGNSNTSFETSTLDHIGSKSNLERTSKMVVETSHDDKAKDVSNMQLLSHTPYVKTFTNKENSTLGHDESNYEGIGEVLKTPHDDKFSNDQSVTSQSVTGEPDKFDYEGIKEKSKTLLVQKSTDNSNTSFKTSQADKSKDVFNMQLLSHTLHVKTFTNKENSTIGHDDSNYEGIKEVLETSHDAKFSNDQNVTSQSLAVESDQSGYGGIEEKSKSLVHKSTGISNTSFETSTLDHIGSKSKLERTCKTMVETSHDDKSKDVRDIQLLSHTPHIKTFTNKENSTLGHDESNYEGIGEVLKTPHDDKFSNDQSVTSQSLTVEPAKFDYEGIKEKSKTLFVQKSTDNSNTSFKTLQVDKSKDVFDMQLLSHTLHVKTFTNKENSTIGHDESNYEGIKEVLETSHDAKFSNDQNVTLQSLAAESDQSDYGGIEEKSKTPLVHKSTGISNTSFKTSTLDHIGSKSKLERTCKTMVETSHDDKSKDVSDIQLLSHTPHIKTFTNKENSTPGHDEYHYEGIKEVLKTPHNDKFSNDQNVISQSLTVEHDKSNFDGVREMFPTPDVNTYAGTSNATLQDSALQHNGSKSIINSNDTLENCILEHNKSHSSFEGARGMVVKAPPVSKSPDGKDTQLLFQTQHIEKFTNDPVIESATFQCDESKSNYEVVRKMFKTLFGNNLTNNPNVTVESFMIEHNKSDSNFVGIREMFKTPLADKSANVNNMQLLFQTPHVEKSTNDDNDQKKLENNDNSKAHDSEEPEDSFTAVFNKKPVKTYRGKSVSPLKVSGKVNQDYQGFSTPTKIRSDVIDWVQNVNQQWKNKDMFDTPSCSTSKSKENMLPKSSPRRTKRSWQINRRYTDAYVTGMNQFILSQSLKRNNEGGPQVEEMLKLDNQSDDSKSENIDVPDYIMLQIEEALNKYKKIVCSSLCEGFCDSKSTSNNLTEFLVKQLMKIEELRNQGDKEEKNLEKLILARNKKRGRKAMDHDVDYEVVSKASVEQVLTDLKDIDEVVNIFEEDLKYQEYKKSIGLPNENLPGHKLEITQKSDPRNEGETSTKNDKKEASSNIMKTQAHETTKEILTLNSNQLKSSPRKARSGQKMEVKVENANLIMKEAVIRVKREILDVNNTKLAKRHCSVSNELQSSLKGTRCENKEGSKENLEDTVKSIKISDHKKIMPVNSAEKSDKIKTRKRHNVEPDTLEPRLKRARRGKNKDMNAESSSTAYPIQKKTLMTLESAENLNKRQFLPRGTKSVHKALSSEDDLKSKSNIKKHPADKEALTSLELDTSVENLNKRQSLPNKTRHNHKENAEGNGKVYSGKKAATGIEANNIADTLSKPQSLLKRGRRNRKELSSEDYLKSETNRKTRSASIAALTVLEVKTSDKQVLSRKKRQNYVELLLEDGLNAENIRGAHFVNKKQSTSSEGKTLNIKQSLRRRTKCEQSLTNLEANSFNIQQPLSRSTKRGHKKGVNTESSSKGQSAKKEASKRFEADDTVPENLNELQSYPRRTKGDYKESQSNKDQNAKSNSMSCPSKKATTTSLAADDALREHINNEEQFSPRKTRRCGKAAGTEENSNDQKSVSVLSAKKNKATAKKVSFAGDTLSPKDVVKSRSKPCHVQSDQPLDDSSGTRRSRMIGKKQSSKDLENLGRVRLLRTRAGLRKIV